VEPAVTAETVMDLRSLDAFLRGRLRTAGLVAAAVAASACAHAHALGTGRADRPDFEADAGRTVLGGDLAARTLGGQAENGGREEEAATVNEDGFWELLDTEVDARTPAPAQREASRRQGRALLRAARVAWPDAAGLGKLAAVMRGAWPRATGHRGGPHHAVVLGAAAAAGGCGVGEAARIAAYQAVAGPVSAAVRLLALDPMRATGVLAMLAGEIEGVAAQGAGFAARPLDELPCPSAPALDLLAQAHMRAEVRLFES
jgi:urease accessory protein